MKYDLIKCHGCGNDFVIINGFFARLTLSDVKLSNLIKYLTSREGPIGADGVIYIENSKIADAKVEFFNPNGKKTKMCLNGIRCAARFVFDKIGNSNTESVQIESDSGIIKIEREIDSDRDMLFYRIDEIMDIDFNTANVPIIFGSHKCVLNECIKDLSEEYLFTAIKVYTPHLISIVETIDENKLNNLGIKANKILDIFPRGMNVSFVKILDKKNIYVRTFERDSIGMSLSCTSAMVASACVLIRLKYIENDTWINVYNKGGLIKVKCKMIIDNEFRIVVSGPANIVYSAQMELEDLESVVAGKLPMNEDDLSTLNIVNGNVDLEEIEKYNDFLMKTRSESKEAEYLNEMI